jgi:cytochrome c-type biogenesis protein CcmH/NrfG
MKLEDEIAAPPLGAQTASHEEETADRPLPNNLRYLMFGLLVIGVFGIVAFGYVRQASVKPPATPVADDCKDPVTENRLRETLKQTPNDFATLMDWGSYNLSCEKNFATAVAAYQQATKLADDPTTNVAQPAERTEAHFRLGLAYLYNQNNSQAEDQFNLILKEDPKDTSALLALSVSLSKTDPAKAQTYLQQVLEIAPADSDIAVQAKSLLNDLKKQTK